LCRCFCACIDLLALVGGYEGSEAHLLGLIPGLGIGIEGTP
jgi:hypothetical protein